VLRGTAVINFYLIIISLLCLAVCGNAATDNTISDNQISRLQGIQMPFVVNHGQTNKSILAYAQTFVGTAFITADGKIIYSFPESDMDNKASIIKEYPAGGRSTDITLEDKSPTQINIFKGSDASKWATNIPSYNTINLGEVFDGIEIKLRAYANNIEKLFYIYPGSDPDDIRMGFDGITGVCIDTAGRLAVSSGSGNMVFTCPVAYQEIGGFKHEVKIAYKLESGTYRFEVGDYDRSQTLIIDPLLASTYFGGSGRDGILEVPMVMDPEGNIYVAGRTQSSFDFPTTEGVCQEDWGGGTDDAFVAKFRDLRVSGPLVK